MIKLILFDFDGVLTDSNHIHAEVTREAIKKAGIGREIPDRELYSKFGKPYRQVLRELMGKEYSKEKLDKACRSQQKQLHSDLFFSRMHSFPGVIEFLKTLRERGVKTAIATGNDRKFIRRALRETGLNGLFDLILSADDVRFSKPSPDMPEKAMELLGAGRDETLFIGDSVNDVVSAKNAGIKSGVVLTGILDRKAAEKLNPDYIINNISGINDLI